MHSISPCHLSGKTTLMDVIAGRKTIGRIEGEIMANGHPVVSERVYE